MPLRKVTLDDLEIEDAGSFAHVGLYGRLERVVRRSRQPFLVPQEGTGVSWDRATFLNLTFWSPEHSADVLCEPRLPGDVVAHVAWHQLVAAALERAAGKGAPSAAALLCAESIASAFDLYLVGRLLPNAPDSDFITTQVPILREVAEGTLSDDAFEVLLGEVVAAPEAAFEDLRVLLYEVAIELLSCRDALAAQAVLERWSGHRFAPLLHHYQLSNWILYARAYAATSPAHDAAVADLHRTLRAAPVSLDWLEQHWLPET